MKLHFKPTYPCAKCGAKFHTKSRLKQHEKSFKCGNKKSHQCEVCLKSFVSKINLTLHMRSHTVENPFVSSESKNTCIEKIEAKCHINDVVFVQSAQENHPVNENDSNIKGIEKNKASCHINDVVFVQSAQENPQLYVNNSNIKDNIEPQESNGKVFKFLTYISQVSN